MSARPPLTPADCNLADFQFMPVDVQRLLKSETWVLGSAEERAAAMTLWLESWHQLPAASLPKDDRMLAHLSQCKTWKKAKTHALRGWIEASDGRLYHPVVAEKALEAWIEKLANSLSGTAGNAKRWGLSIETDSIRARALEAIAMLRALAPQSKTLKKKVVAVIESDSRGDSGGDSGRDKKRSGGDPPKASGGESGGDRKGQGQGQGQGLVNQKEAAAVNSTTLGPPTERGSAAPPPGRAVQIAVLLRKLGIQASSTHPTVATDWANDPKVTDEVLQTAVQTAQERKPGERIPVGYLPGIVQDLAHPKAHASPPPAPEIPAWQRSRAGIEAKGRELGMELPLELPATDLIRRIEKEIRSRGTQP